MKNNFLKYGKMSLAFFAFFLFLLFPFEAFAKNSIQISPLTYNFEIKAGESSKAKITITNSSGHNFDYICQVEDFYGTNEQGAPIFSKNQAKNNNSGLADWLNIPNNENEGIIAPGGKKIITANIIIPKNANPGGYYAAVFVGQNIENNKSPFSISSRVGTLILVSVPGNGSKAEAIKKAEIGNFSFPKIIWSNYKLVLNYGKFPKIEKRKIDFKALIKNTGMVHYDANAAVGVKSIFGNEDRVDLGTHTILPGSNRSYNGEWNKKYPFGYYKLTLIVANQEQILASEKTSILVIPLPLIIGIFIILFLLISFIRTRLNPKKHTS